MKGHLAAKLGLIVTVITLATTIWAYAAEFTRMYDHSSAEIDKLRTLKADKAEVIGVHRKLDLIICYLDKNKCLMQGK